MNKYLMIVTIAFALSSCKMKHFIKQQPYRCVVIQKDDGSRKTVYEKIHRKEMKRLKKYQDTISKFSASF